jgi:glycosyltransferase involved in cell wall biosynthesis
VSTDTGRKRPRTRALRVAPPAARTRILLTTEGTYPYVVGGVTSWCDLIVRALPEFDWQVLPIIAAHGRPPIYELPSHARPLGPVELWSEAIPRGWPLLRAERRTGFDLPAALVRALLAWDGDPEALRAALLWCRRFPAGIRRSFRSRHAWESYKEALRAVMRERIPEAGTPPRVDLVEAAILYQTLYWVARTAAVPTPATDILHVTAAGWAAIPALAHKARHDTPMVLTEHGVYVREAYLAGARASFSAGSRFIATRLARGLARAAYAAADVVAPVTDANARWEEGLGLDPGKIHVLYNGVTATRPPVPPPRTKTVVSVGRIDPLKDLHTMLRTAAETLRHVPDATFLHYGPVTPGEEEYGRGCMALHARLGLGDRFRFMGRTTDPEGVVRDADAVLMTSISEGLPIAILEAMGQGRPVVTTGVGGVPDVVRGCGVIAAPGDAHALALGLVSLLRRPALAWAVGQRGHRRLGRTFDEASCVSGYRDLLEDVAAGRRPGRRERAPERAAVMAPSLACEPLAA